MASKIVLPTLALVLAGPSLAWAEEFEDDETGWSFEVTVGVEYEPAYTGSDVYTSEPSLDATATYTDQRGIEWSIGVGGVGVAFDVGPSSELEFTLEYEPGRENDDDPILAGFPEMANTWELQAVYTREYGPWYLGLGLQTDILNKGKGTVGFVGGGYRTMLTDRLGIQTSLDFSFANSEHMNTEVGISPATAAATGLASYTASGGYKGATLGLDFDYALTERTALVGAFSLERYGSSMADSPLIATHGTATNFEGGLGLQFRF